MRAPVAVVIALVLFVAGCGSGDGGAVLSVEEAVNHQGRAEVTGFLHANGSDVRLCAAVLESYPPQCGRPALDVEGLDLASVDGLQREGTVAWKERVTLTAGC